MVTGLTVVIIQSYYNITDDIPSAVHLILCVIELSFGSGSLKVSIVYCLATVPGDGI